MSDPEKAPITILNSLKGTKLEVNAVLMEEEFSIGELTKLSPGSVLMFDKKEGSDAALTANGKTFARGEVVQVGDRYGLKVNELID